MIGALHLNEGPVGECLQHIVRAGDRGETKIPDRPCHEEDRPKTRGELQLHVHAHGNRPWSR